MCQAAAPGSVCLCREGARRAASGVRPQKMPETVAARGRLREGGPGSPVSSGQVLVGTLCADQQREPSAETPAVLGTDLIHEVNTESDTSRPSPGGVEITGTFPSLRSCQLDLDEYVHRGTWKAADLKCGARGPGSLPSSAPDKTGD